MPERDADDVVGTVAEEAAKFLRALGADEWAARAEEGSRRSPSGEGRTRCPECGSPIGDAGPDETPDPHLACRHCPVCRGASFLRRATPETFDGLADAVGLLGTALQEVADRLRERDPDRGGPEHARPGHAAADEGEEDTMVRDGDAAEDARPDSTKETS